MVSLMMQLTSIEYIIQTKYIDYNHNNCSLLRVTLIIICGNFVMPVFRQQPDNIAKPCCHGFIKA